MLLREIINKTSVKDVVADPDIDIRGVSHDTRVLRAGELFVAIKGYESDGHHYIAEAVEKGAVCIVCEKAPELSTPYILVDDSRKALATVSAAWFGYPASKLKLIGVTGTNGKTSVTNLIKRIIEKCSDAKVGLIGTNGNLIGDRELHTEHTTPESYDMQKLLDKMSLEGCEYVVMEVSSHALYLSRVHGIEYDVGVFTNLSPEHLDFHKTMEAYADAKSLLFMSCRESVINIDDAYAPLMIERAAGNVMTYAVNDMSADLVGKDIKLEADKVEFCSLAIGSLDRVEMPIPGLFSVYNALAAIAAAKLLGFGTADIVSSLRLCEGVKGRAEIVPTGRAYTVLIDYAHTPDALGNIITAVRGFARGKVITLFGCGGDRDKAKRPLMGRLATELSDFVIVTSDNPRTEVPGKIIDDILSGMEDTSTPFRVIENRREAICRALDDLQTGDVLILAGKGHETYQILGKDKIHFDEREVVADYLKQQRAEERKQVVEGLD
jgi:UDP-N-acetylmuramoyl-L-alanyl-D-glutamate--2,6-diaminopimelate ligase